MTEPIEELIFEFLEPVIAAAQSDSNNPLYGVELHDTEYRPITDEHHDYVQIGSCDSELAPNPGATEMLEFDANVILICLAKVLGKERSDRHAARKRVVAITKAVAQLFCEDPTMGDRVNLCRVMRCPRDWASVNSNPYAVANVPLLVNES